MARAVAVKRELPFEVEPSAAPNVVRVRHEIKSVGNWEQWYLLRSDAHWDNPDSNWDLQKAHLDEAVERKAGVLDFGDLFCAMQGKWDKRSSKEKLRPEHQAYDYLDALVRTAADWHQPYAHNWVAQGLGNHETSILKRHETNLTERWCQTLRDRTGAPMLITGYSGWVQFLFKVSTQRHSKNLWHIHGYAGGGQVTKDMIQANRQQVYVENADIMVSGHTHDQWSMRFERTSLNSAGNVVRKNAVYIKCPTYKDEYKTGEGGWHIETGKPPKPLGAYWLRFFVGTEKKNDGKSATDKAIKFEIREALA